MYVLEVEHIPEVVVPGKRLGRHIVHDERSKAYAVRAADPATLTSVEHKRLVPIFDQGDIGDCTINAALGALGTAEFFPAVQQPVEWFSQDTIVPLYSEETANDEFPGQYPPDDTGSSGLAAAKTLHKHGWISGYQHAMSLEAALTALQKYAVITGVDWYSGMDDPDSSGHVVAQGTKRGGHEFLVRALDVVNRTVLCDNSWGPDWGLDGSFTLTWDDWGRLLDQGGDVTVLIPATAPAPVPTPAPTPVVTNADDAALIAALDPWQRGIVSRHTKAGKAASAYRTWKQIKGY